MSYLFKRSDVLDFARATGAETREKGNEIFWRLCPYCNGGGHDKDTFSVNAETGAFKCFRASCGKQGHFVELARDFDYPLDMGEPKVYRKLPQKAVTVTSPAIEYLASRGIGREVTGRYKITTRRDNDSILVFPFYDERNVLQFIKYRNTKYSGKGNKEWCEKDTKPILFGMAQCTGFDRLIITEGQIDSLSVAECGYENAVSVPTGAQGFTWLNHCWEWIIKFKTVLVFGDYERGKITLLETLQARLPQKVIAVRPQDYLGEKDANAILTTFGKQAVCAAIDNAEAPRLSNVKRLSSVKNVDINKLDKIATNIKEIDRTIGGLIVGQLVLLTGRRGEGKSTFMSQLICEALEQDYNTFVYSGELADFHFKRWIDFQLAGGDNVITNINAFGDEEYTLLDSTAEQISNWYHDKAWVFDNGFVPDMNAEFESIITTIERAVKQYDIRFVCIDNLMTAMDIVDRQDNLYLAQSNFVGQLKKIAVKYNIVVLLVAHPRKSSNDFTNDDVSGSADITNKVDVVMSYSRAKEADDCDSKLQITKNRLTGKLAKDIELFYSPKTKRIFGRTSTIRRYGWEGVQTKWSEIADDDELPF
jgi:archaellum biogenesis ATPase FlaH